ncbi:PREDICTED: protein phosphatase 2C 7-like [Camelina sativa]|uniref:protein-serine/threonine phosphatase n=1 Tax=Camelina sativa TaxID=90675 RepID=A0ABM1QXF0_CAMSA|nr:PREDICTED: protein phosphatase 2C 7-like [Camelina sativa]
MQDSVIALPHFLKIPIEMFMGDHEGMNPSLSHIPCHFFGVYDGHGGSQVAEYYRDRIHFALAEEIERIKDKLCNSESSENRQVQWKKVFTNCFLRVVDEVAGKIGCRPSTGSFDNILEAVVPESIGSTAVVALVCSSHIIVSNCGNSRVVLLRGKESMHLSVDQRPEREDEYARIEKTGGKVVQWQGARSSFSVLNTSRSIGDEYLEPYVRPDPEVMFMPRAREDECLILASDGVWDVMSNQEACDFARKRILAWHKKNGAWPLAERGVGEDHACQAAADYLYKLALQREAKTM